MEIEVNRESTLCTTNRKRATFPTRIGSPETSFANLLSCSVFEMPNLFSDWDLNLNSKCLFREAFCSGDARGPFFTWTPRDSRCDFLRNHSSKSATIPLKVQPFHRRCNHSSESRKSCWMKDPLLSMKHTTSLLWIVFPFRLLMYNLRSHTLRNWIYIHSVCFVQSHLVFFEHRELSGNQFTKLERSYLKDLTLLNHL